MDDMKAIEFTAYFCGVLDFINDSGSLSATEFDKIKNKYYQLFPKKNTLVTKNVLTPVGVHKLPPNEEGAKVSENLAGDGR